MYTGPMETKRTQLYNGPTEAGKDTLVASSRLQEPYGYAYVYAGSFPWHTS